ncbi:MAG: cyclic nucleotide-binding domain-containing protein [Pseudomonadota bacterium]
MTQTPDEAGALGRIDILEGLEPAVLGSLAAGCRWRRHAPGARLIVQDELGADVFFLVEGTARVLDIGPDGREVTYSVVDAGAVLGDIAVHAPFEWVAAAPATTPSPACRDSDAEFLASPPLLAPAPTPAAATHV